MTDNKALKPRRQIAEAIFSVKSTRIWALTALFCIGIFVAGMIISLIGSASRNALLAGSLIQDLFAFIAPALICGYVFTHKPWQWTEVAKGASALSFAGVIAVFVVSVPALNWLVELNESMSLPQWLSGLEALMRQMEDSAAVTTKLLLSDTSVWGLISGVLIVGILGPFSEELFFRGALQKVLYGPNPWKAVWWSALIFSLLHFQMYGFVPRFLLGLWFGYLYLWTGSIWTSVFGHILNNTVTVVSQWLIANGIATEQVFAAGTDGNLWLVCISMLLTIVSVWGVKRVASRSKILF